MQLLREPIAGQLQEVSEVVFAAQTKLITATEAVFMDTSWLNVL